MELHEIKEKINLIKNTKDIENIESILNYDDLGKNIIEVLNAVKKLTIPNVVDTLTDFSEYCDEEHDLFIPSWMIDNYDKNR